MSYRDDFGTVSTDYHNTPGRITNHIFKYLPFNTNYNLEVRTMFREDKILGRPIRVSITTQPFRAPVDPLKATVNVDNTVTLYWSSPRTIDLKKNLKVRKFVFPLVD